MSRTVTNGFLSNFENKTRGKPVVFPVLTNLLRYSDTLMLKNGIIMELGVYQAGSTNEIAQTLKDRTVHGFDSFEGLPEKWRDGFEKGAFSMSNLPIVEKNVKLHVGWFDKTLPIFQKEIGNEQIALCHVDCDLYSSTMTFFDEMNDNIQEGTILCFDELINYPGYEKGEIMALEDFLNRRNDLDYEVLSLAYPLNRSVRMDIYRHQQVAIRFIKK